MLDQLKNTVKNTFLYSIGNMAGKLSGIILLPLYTKHLPIEEYGLLALLEVFYIFILAISGFGIKSALTRYYWDPELKGREKELFFTSYSFNVVVGLLTIFTGYLLLANFSSVIFGTELSPAFTRVFILATLVRIMADTPMLLLRIQHKAIWQTTIQLITLLVTVGLTVYLIAYRDMDLIAVFYAQLAAGSIGLLLLLKTLIRNIRWQLDLKLLKELLHFGIPLFLSNLLSVVLVLSDRFILNIFGTLQHVGNFALAYKISNIIQVVFVTSFMSAYQHIFYKQMSEENSGRFYTKSMTYFVLIIVFVSVGLVLFSKETIKVLSRGEMDYWDSYTLIPMLVLGVVFGGIRHMLILPLSRLKKTRIISTITIAVALLNFGLNLLLIPSLNSIGAAIATALAQITASVWLYMMVLKHDSIRYEMIKISKCLALGVVFYGLSVLTDDMSLTWRLILKSLLYLSFFYLLYLWRFYEAIELERLKGAWRKWIRLKDFWKNISEIKLQ